MKPITIANEDGQTIVSSSISKKTFIVTTSSLKMENVLDYWIGKYPTECRSLFVKTGGWALYETTQTFLLKLLVASLTGEKKKILIGKE